MKALRQVKYAELLKIPEVFDRSNFLERVSRIRTPKSVVQLTNQNLRIAVEGGLLTYLLHCEARIASYLGKGFYTIGPCGEELIGVISLNLTSTDLTALHYRHVSNSIVRQMIIGHTPEEIALARARAYACSTREPVTGGKHCSIGSNDHNKEFIVTSTLASQAPSAVGRALAIPFSYKLLGNYSKFDPKAISYVSVGDGSVNNAHFLSAFNFAKYCEHRHIKCPVVFVISDNNKCISLKGYDWVKKFVNGFSKVVSNPNLSNMETADGNDILDIFIKSKRVIDYCRQYNRPALLVVNKLPRRFGHAATDRQLAYMTKEDIELEQSKDPLAAACSLAISCNAYSESEFIDLFHNMVSLVEDAFDQAVGEDKISSRETLIHSNSQVLDVSKSTVDRIIHRNLMERVSNIRVETMRKHMTSVFDELLQTYKECVYIGEDVEHGGYYLVTDGLAAKYPLRVRNFPPDETALMGTAIGYSQAGLVPVVEIPYSKYLDCAFDMFNEAIIANWLSDGHQPNGMVIRLQGFDKGIFGGNFHTHNSLSMPPGLDVVCYSNGEDYVRGMRFAFRQARAGRVVMSVDSTDLLNKRHLDFSNTNRDGRVDSDKNDFWLTAYPSNCEDELTFDSVVVYHSPTLLTDVEKVKTQYAVIITYGNGVPTSLNARNSFLQQKNTSNENIHVSVVDVPCISQLPKQLVVYLNEYKPRWIVFADVCKQGASMPLSGIALQLQNEGLLCDVKWNIVGATATYNPLGTSLTFLNGNDVKTSLLSLLNAKYVDR